MRRKKPAKALNILDHFNVLILNALYAGLLLLTLFLSKGLHLIGPHQVAPFVLSGPVSNQPGQSFWRGLSLDIVERVILQQNGLQCGLVNTQEFLIISLN